MGDGIQFFGEVDGNKGQPGTGMGGDYPGWYFDNPRGSLAMLKEEVSKLEEQNRTGAINRAQILKNEVMIKEKRKRYDAIVKSRPKFSGAEKDKVAGWCDEVGEGIADVMYTRKDDSYGLASPQEEVNHSLYPCVDVPKEFAVAMGHKLGRGGGANVRVNRTLAEKWWKIGRKSLGERSNVEALRRES